MATPYFQLRLDRVPSTQDLAREQLAEVPVLVTASEQTHGRGRSGSGWLNADRALAVSLAFRAERGDDRPFSLMAGVAAVRATDGTSLKWPNDLMSGESKVGGILVEKSGDVVVIGLGVNLWWPSPSDGAGALHEEDPGRQRHLELGALWGAELIELLGGPGWPRDEYSASCRTLGRDITWDPNGRGRALDITDSGALLVETATGREEIHSGAVTHIRPS
ncbi:MAG TPA: biotin--[acetyl-CoA-carboxylase] ligase [Acidimicrobiia bacterium]|nr:biotin--[acetyl-CoA-carboxylase] ligase [Acidimicrobiia bacterium]